MIKNVWLLVAPPPSPILMLTTELYTIIKYRNMSNFQLKKQSINNVLLMLLYNTDLNF